MECVSLQYKSTLLKDFLKSLFLMSVKKMGTLGCLAHTKKSKHFTESRINSVFVIIN